MYLGLKENAKEEAAGRQKINETDVRLRRELLETHLALIARSGCDDNLKTSALNLLIEAGKHLGEPKTNSRVVYGDSFFVQWNEEGLALVNQAKALLSEKPVLNSVVTSLTNESPDVLHKAISDTDENAIHSVLKGVSEAVGFVFWHSNTNPSLEIGWKKDFADKCAAMGFKLRQETIPNPDQTGHMDELYKTIVYISH